MDSDEPLREARYDPALIESRRQAAWRERDAFRTPAAGGARSVYIKASAPFTSGNIHMGTVRHYSIADSYGRFLRARGDEVLLAFGFDAFGLPAELQAIANDMTPSDWVAQCAQHMRRQLDRLGFSFDWERSFMSSDEQMYRWSQWLFVRLLEQGLIYRSAGSVDWCDTCQTTLATIQVENGLCWRCHNPVRLIQIPQWYLRLSAYLGENDARLAQLQASGIWDEVALASQRFVLGRVDGVELDVDGPGGEPLTLFTPHAGSLSEARFVLMSPRHPDVEEWAGGPEVQAQLEELRSGGWQRSARDARQIPLVQTGHTVSTPFAEEPLPVLISPTVDGRFGATAVLGIPAEDHSDEMIAERLGLWEEHDVRAAGDGGRATSAGADGGGPGANGGGRVAGARAAVRYRANDFSISRQRSWGTPIPIVHCAECGAVPVPVEDLPVRLPRDLRPTGQGNPLEEREDFVNTTCPSCGGPGRRETDTLDCHFDSFWLWIPACVPPADRDGTLEEILALPELRRWLPSKRLIAGSDSGNFVFDQRIITKALRDMGPLAYLDDGEPFAGALFHEMVLRDGRKMSKHLGNVVDPDELTEAFGADTLRLATLYAARPQRSLNWSDSAVQRCHRFLRQLWSYSQERFAAAARARGVRAQDEGPASPDDSAVAGEEQGGQAGAVGGHREQVTGGPQEDSGARDETAHLRVRLQKWCDTAVERTTADLESLEMHSAVRNVMRLFERVRDYEKLVVARRGSLDGADLEALVGALALIAALIAPLAPHVGEELWLVSGRQGQPVWPAVGDPLAEIRA